MQIQHQHQNGSGTFFIEKEGQRIAEMTYEQKHEKMIINHTEVDDELRGQNIGSDLVEAGVEYARRSNLKIEPLCPFAKKIIEEHKEFQDVLV